MAAARSTGESRGGDISVDSTPRQLPLPCSASHLQRNLVLHTLPSNDETSQGASWVEVFAFAHRNQVNAVTAHNGEMLSSEKLLELPSEVLAMCWMPESGTASTSTRKQHPTLAAVCRDKVVATQGQGTANSWEGHCPQGDNFSEAVAYLAGKELLCCGLDSGAVAIFEGVQSQQPRSVVKMHSAAVSCLCFDPTGRTMCSGADDGIVCCWEVGSWKRLFSVDQGRGFPCTSVAMSKQHLLASYGNGTFSVHKPTDGSLQSLVRAHARAINCIDVFSDGKLVVTGSDDGTVNLWEMHSTGDCRLVFTASVRNRQVCGATLCQDTSSFSFACFDSSTLVSFYMKNR